MSGQATENRAADFHSQIIMKLKKAFILAMDINW